MSSPAGPEHSTQTMQGTVYMMRAIKDLSATHDTSEAAPPHAMRAAYGVRSLLQLFIAASFGSKCSAVCGGRLHDEQVLEQDLHRDAWCGRSTTALMPCNSAARTACSVLHDNIAGRVCLE